MDLRTNRIQLSLWVGLVLFLLAASFALLLYFILPETPASRGPLLLASFTAVLIGGLVCLLFLLRWLLRPYRQLVGEAEQVPISSTLQSTTDEAEFVLETFQSVVAQLNAQRQELKKLSDEASERANSAERFSDRIVASVPSGLVAFDGNGKSMVINSAARKLLAVDGNALGQPVSSLLGNLPQLREMVEECLQTGRLFRREEIETTAEDRVPRRLGATIAPIDLASERGGHGALCLLTDITEVTHLREQVALKKNLESLGEMSAGLAHEFKNTIATLHGYVQLLQSLNLNEQGQLATDQLLNEVRNLSEMVTAFLNFARPQPLNLETVSVAEVLAECVEELKGFYREQQVILLFDPPTGVPDVRGDERMLRQAFLNLLRNAAEAIPDGQAEREVEICCSSEVSGTGRDSVRVEIRDSGEGIPESDLQRIFIPFFTTKATGHGVGLALAHRVITEHGGSLVASNSIKGGAVFTVRLPLEKT